MLNKALLVGKPDKLISQKHVSLAELFIDVVNRHSDKGMTFVNSHGDEQFVNYKDLLNSSLKLLSALQERGFTSGDRLIIEVNTPSKFYVLFWACILGAIIPVPVSSPKEVSSRSQGLEKLMQISKVLGYPPIITEQKSMHKYDQLVQCNEYTDLVFYCFENLESTVAAKVSPTDEHDIIFLQFSSGSTGFPKGVELTNANIIANISALGCRLRARADDIVFTWLPHTHDMGIFCQYLTAVLHGSSIVIFSPFGFVYSPYLFLKKITEHQGSWFGCPNFGYQLMVDKISSDQMDDLNLSSLRFVINGAEPISLLLINKFNDKFAKCGFKPPMMLPAYGMAEATVAIALPEVGNSLIAERLDKKRLMIGEKMSRVFPADKPGGVCFVAVGQPVNGISIRIVDANNQLVEPGVLGNIQIKGSSVTSGYYGLDNNQQSFYEGWFKTGDIGLIIDGSIVVTGREKDMVIIRGVNYMAHSLEEIIYSNTTVKEGCCACVGVIDPHFDREILLVFIKTKVNPEHFSPIYNAILSALQQRIGIGPNYILPVKSLPRTTSGKLQRFKLKEAYLNGEYASIIKTISEFVSPTPNTLAHHSSEVSDRTTLKLKTIWATILAINENDISIDASFYSLGGNSLKAFECLGKMQQQLSPYIDMEVFINCNTIRLLANYLNVKIWSKPSLRERVVPKKPYVSTAIAVTGMALRVPGAHNVHQFWQNLCSGVDSITRVSQQRNRFSGEKNWHDWVGELAGIHFFDHDFFGISHKEAIIMDPQQRVMLEVCYHALEDAAIMPFSRTGRSIGVYAGISANTYSNLVNKCTGEQGYDQMHQNLLVGSLINMVAARLSHTFNFTGPSIVVDTACSSFLVALHQAVSAIRTGSIKGAVVSAANIMATPLVHQLAKKAGIISSTQFTKVFDQAADGSVLGEGVVVFYLEPLEFAITNNKKIYGIIRGSATNNDGCSFGVMAPNPKGQLDVLQQAYADANVSPSELDYIELHGSGTAIGDPIEINTLARLFAKHATIPKHKIGLGSVKTNIGHLLPAASAAGLAKVLLSLQHKQLFASLHLKNENPAIELHKKPFYIVNKLKKWTPANSNLRKAGISAFGLGGSNAHVVVEEYIGKTSTDDITCFDILTLSAKSPVALKHMIHNVTALITSDSKININDICFTRNCHRQHYKYRAALLVEPPLLRVKPTFFVAEKTFNPLPNTISIYIGDGLLMQSSHGQNNPSSTDPCFESRCLQYFKNQGINLNQKLIVNHLSLIKDFLYWYFVIQDLVAISEVKFLFEGCGSGVLLRDLLIGRFTMSEVINVLTNEQLRIGDAIMTGDTFNANLRTDPIIFFGDSCGDVKLAEHNSRTFGAQAIAISREINMPIKKRLCFVMSQLYIRYIDFNWQKFYANNPRKLVTVPSYPFEKNNCWVNLSRGVSNE